MHVKPRVKQLLSYTFENLYSEFNSVSIATRIHSSTDLAERIGSTKTGKVSAAQALSQVAS